MSDAATYSERRAAGDFERMAAERAAELAAQAVEPEVVPDPNRTHIPIGSDVELQQAIDEGGGGSGGGSLTDLTDVTGEPGPGKSPVADDAGSFPLTRVTTEDDLTAVLDSVAEVVWHDIGAPGEPPFLSQFFNLGDPWSPARYRALLNSTVRVQGTVGCSDPTIVDATWIPIFQIPAEHAPGANLEFFTFANDANPCRMFVWADGTVVWGGYTSTPHPPIDRLPLNFLSWSTVSPGG